MSLAATLCIYKHSLFRCVVVDTLNKGCNKRDRAIIYIDWENRNNLMKIFSIATLFLNLPETIDVVSVIVLYEDFTFT